MLCVALDSGHGKTTPGKRSFDGSLLEYEFNRDVTARVKAHLERHGVRVLLTSPDPAVDPTLSERCRRANSANASIFVSIHANAYGTAWNDANGWEIFVYRNTGEQATLAKCIESESIPFLGLRNRGIKTADFTVLTGTKMPAVLIEHGFYTNKVECDLLKTDDFREKCAVADAKGILRYLGAAWTERGAGDIALPSQNATESPAPHARELTSPNDIVWELGARGLVTDKAGMLADIEKEPNGRLYWLARKTANLIRDASR